MKTFLIGSALGAVLSALAMATGDVSPGNIFGAALDVSILSTLCGIIAISMGWIFRLVDAFLQRRFPAQELPPDVTSRRLRTGARWTRESGQVLFLGVFAIWAFMAGGDVGPALRRDSDASGGSIVLAALGVAAALKAIQEAARLATEIIAARWEAEADEHARIAALLDMSCPSITALERGER